jgi:hypothetical protein
MGRITLAAWFITTLISYFALGGFLGKLIEGYDRAALSLTPVTVTIMALLVSLALTVRWQMDRTHPQEGAETATDTEPPSARRRFLFGSLAATGGILVTLQAAVAKNFGWYSVTGRNIFMVRPPYKADVARDEWTGARVSEYRRLGRTEARISDISLGSGAGTGGRQTVEVAREAIERGVNYFDTAPDYSETGSEQRLGEAMKGLRDQILSPQRTRRPGQLSERLHRSGERLSCAAANGSG